ncbi:7521_t:CDS:2 [Cetraspora pellucida]|uniref:7521_t:CDS:1 n=1 Tax=Cetraspora pellucida TaxID=1433469 RepID=A0A9N9I0K5_9GLOM|nr:7521_t:CDS:2 [Cetraspora pellucida]
MHSEGSTNNMNISQELSSIDFSLADFQESASCSDFCGVKELYIYSYSCGAKEFSVCSILYGAKKSFACSNFHGAKESFTCDLNSIDHSVAHNLSFNSVTHSHSVIYDLSVVHDHSVVYNYSYNVGQVVHNFDKFVNLNEFFQENEDGTEYKNATKTKNEPLHPIAGEGFDIMKKTLNLAIAMGRVEELYEIHKNFTGKMENEVVNQARNSNNIAEFVLTISNPISVRTKSDKENRVGRPQKILKDADLNVSKSSKIKERKCGICNKEGHNAHTCPKGS